MRSFVCSCSRLAQPALSPRCPRRGWLTAGGASQRGTQAMVCSEPKRKVWRSIAALYIETKTVLRLAKPSSVQTEQYSGARWEEQVSNNYVFACHSSCCPNSTDEAKRFFNRSRH